MNGLTRFHPIPSYQKKKKKKKKLLLSRVPFLTFLLSAFILILYKKKKVNFLLQKKPQGSHVGVIETTLMYHSTQDLQDRLVTVTLSPLFFYLHVRKQMSNFKY